MNGSQLDETTKTARKKHREDKRILIAYIDEPSCHLTAGRMPGSLACCMHRDFLTVRHQSHTLLPTLVVFGVVKLGAFSIPKVQNAPSSAASPPRKLWKARPFTLLYQWPFFHCLPTARCFWKFVFCWWPFTVSLSLKFLLSPLLAFNLVGSLKREGWLHLDGFPLLTKML